MFIISRGTLYELQWRGNFADTWYLYCGPMVFICAIALLTLVKNTLYTRIGIIANPNTVPQKIDGFEWLPINLYINGDTFYYILYGMLGRAIGMMDPQHKALSWVWAAL